MAITILFYSCNEVSRKVYETVWQQIQETKGESDEVIAVTQNGEPRADIDIVLRQEGKSLKNIYERIQAGAERASNEIIAIAEDDIIYPFGYWREAEETLRSENEPYETLIYNWSMIRLNDSGFSNCYNRKYTLSQLIAYRDKLVFCARNRIKLLSKYKRYKSGEFTEGITKFWSYGYPTIDIRHGANLTKANFVEDYHWNSFTRSNGYWGRALPLLDKLGLEPNELGKVWKDIDKQIDKELEKTPSYYNELTIATTFRDAPQNILAQIHNYASYQQETLDRLRFVFVNDRSTADNSLDALGEKLLSDRANVKHIRREGNNNIWTIGDARNEAIEDSGGKGRILLIDSDMILEESEALRLLALNDSRPITYYLTVRGYDGKAQWGGKNQLLARVEDLNRVGGYHSAYSGSYGYEDEDLRLMLSNITEVIRTDISVINMETTGKGKNKDLDYNKEVFRYLNTNRIKALLGITDVLTVEDSV